VTVRRRFEQEGHSLFVDSFFSSPYLLDDLHTRGMNCYGTVRQNCKGMPRGLDIKTLKLKWGDKRARVEHNRSGLERQVILKNVEVDKEVIFLPRECNYTELQYNSVVL
jgi:hypothetical protein